MCKEYQTITIPPEKETIWRYMSFFSFVSMLHHQALHFTRVDQLDDPFEGSFPRLNVKIRPTTYKEKMPVKKINLLSEMYREYVKHTFINCWHINKYQSAAMWKLYLQSNEGIAIKSTVGSLRTSFIKSKYELSIGQINYIRYSKDLIPEGPLFPYFHKRKSFEHEHELRVVIQDHSRDSQGDIIWSNPRHKSGLMIKIDLDNLIDRIIVAPLCPSWQQKLVKPLLEKYGVNKSVTHSTLYTRDYRIVY